MHRRLSLSAALLCAALAQPAAAAEQWQAYETADDTGNVTAQLRFGVPETGVVRLAATCPGATGRIDMALYIPTGAIVAGDPATVRFATPGHAEQSRPGAVVEDAFGTHAVVQLPPDDPLWARIAAALTVTVGVTGTRSTALDLTGSREAVGRFLQSCAILPPVVPAPSDPTPPPAASDAEAPDAAPGEPPADAETAASEDDTGTDETGADETGEGAEDDAGSDDLALPVPDPTPAPPPTYPIFVTGPDPLPAYSAVRFGIALDPIPPGTALLRTGGMVTRDGFAWVEVTTQDARGRTVWVRRDTLEPPFNPAAAYRNPSADANLLIREAPDPTAAILGTIPPLAIGIEDLGVHQGDWAQVRFGAVSGWVSYIYLQPYGPDGPVDLSGRADSAPPPARTGPVAPAQPYTATHGAWTVDCQPCRDPADGATCRLSTASTATLDRRATLELTPNADDGTTADLQLRYDVDAAVPGPDDASLAYAIDAAAPQAIAADGWSLTPETGDILVPSATLTPLLTPLGGGSALTLTVSDGARSWVDQFALTGFVIGVADLSARLPLPSQHGDEDACPAAAGEDDAAGQDGTDPVADPPR